ncbi:hypothetical protein MHLP_03515 [Candidatus Mycoplasma haematolamae str. Purdue]|uniref:Uncharacterized protein n=1 Tax=Mycoplasma haematolamae (strain Purdue) TaxID=1212765 RepID=I7BK79_MYCHA|nr:hypothetical protein MHLP_03515 [Candidatus Mycoplasma haematolamae str. Purdue]
MQGWAANSGVKFAKEAWEKTWEPGTTVTPVGMIMRALRGNEFSKVCTDNQMKNVKEKYFKDECGQKIKDHDKVEVVDVLKSAWDQNSSSWLGSSDWRVATKGKEGGWAGQPKVNDYSQLSSLGYQDGLVSEQCSHMSGMLAGFLFGTAAEKPVCNKILEGVFGNQVDQKRYCGP